MMGKIRSIKQQINYAISKNFKEKVKKRDYKLANGYDMSNKIFSYSEMYRLKDTARDLNNFLKENEIKRDYVIEITNEDIKKFLESKIETCTQQTLNTYTNSLYKIQKAINNTYNSELSWSKSVKAPQTNVSNKSEKRGVESVISNYDYKKIVKYAKENRSESGDAIRLQREIGVRVEEIVDIKKENINFEKKEILITNSKGGKRITKKIKNIDLVKAILEKNYDEKFLFSVKSSSINRYLNRVQDKLCLERHSFHDLRRRVGQNFYDKALQQGLSEEKALLETSKFLNHRTKRKKLMEESYIKRNK